MSSPVRILALCGYSQNAITFATSLRGALLQSPSFDAAAAWKPLSGSFQKFQLPPSAGEQGDRVGTVVSQSKDGRAEFTFLDPPIVLGREHLAPVHVKEYEKNLKEASDKHHVTPRAWWLVPDRDTYAGECGNDGERSCPSREGRVRRCSRVNPDMPSRARGFSS